MTKSQRAIEVLEETCGDLAELRRSPHTDDDIRERVNRATIAIELFIKDAIYLRKKDKHRFEDLIDGLRVQGLAEDSVTAFHDMRKLYNKAHHSVVLEVSLSDAIDVVEKARKAMTDLSALGIGESTFDARPAYRHVFWIAGWFHANGGDVETDIIAPDDSITFTWASHDQIYLKLSAWDTLESELLRVGHIRKGADAVPQTVLDRFEEIGDLVNCFEFEGDYRQLLRVLASHEDRQDLLPDLLRENNELSMLQAACFGTVDFANRNAHSIDVEAVSAGIADLCASEYAAPKTSRHVAKYTRRLATLLVNNTEWKRLAGPQALASEAFDELIAQGSAMPESPERALFAISSDNVLLLAV